FSLGLVRGKPARFLRVADGTPNPCRSPLGTAGSSNPCYRHHTLDRTNSAGRLSRKKARLCGRSREFQPSFGNRTHGVHSGSDRAIQLVSPFSYPLSGLLPRGKSTWLPP